MAEPASRRPVLTVDDAYCGVPSGWRHIMRKMILMALAGFIWRKVQSRVAKRAFTGKGIRRPR